MICEWPDSTTMCAEVTSTLYPECGIGLKLPLSDDILWY